MAEKCCLCEATADDCAKQVLDLRNQLAAYKQSYQDEQDRHGETQDKLGTLQAAARNMDDADLFNLGRKAEYGRISEHWHGGFLEKQDIAMALSKALREALGDK